MAEFDLGASRRKRDSQEPKYLVITGEDEQVEAKYPLVGDLPIEFLDAGAAARFIDAFRSLFLDPKDADEFFDTYKPSLVDLGEITGDLYPGVGADVGEALASGRSSTRSGRR